MKKYKNILFYVFTIGAFAVLMYFLDKQGKSLENLKKILPAQGEETSILQHFSETIHHNVTHPLAILLLQILTIIFTARTFGFIFHKIGQPTVIGEILAGIFLGPS